MFLAAENLVDSGTQRCQRHGEEDGVKQGVGVVEERADDPKQVTVVAVHNLHGEEDHNGGPAEDHADHQVGQYHKVLHRRLARIATTAAAHLNDETYKPIANQFNVKNVVNFNLTTHEFSIALKSQFH